MLNAPSEIKMVPWKEAYISFWKKSFDWSGRATRAEYWWPQLTNGLIGFVIGIIVAINAIINELGDMGVIMPTFVLMLIFIAPNLSVMARRFHDLGYGTKFAIIPLIIYDILYIYYLFHQKTSIRVRA